MCICVRARAQILECPIFKLYFTYLYSYISKSTLFFSTYELKNLRI